MQPWSHRLSGCGGVIHRSHSQINTYLKCGEAYRLEKVVKAPQYPAAWQHAGSAFHTVAERYERSERELTVAQAQELYLSEYRRLIAESRDKWPDLSVWGKAGQYKPETYIASLEEKGPEWVANYIAYALAADWEIWRLPDGSPAVEIPFFIDLGTVRVRGFIDQVLIYPDGSLLVRDLKAGSKNPKDELQLGLYAEALRELFGEDATHGDYYMAKKGAALSAVNLSMYSRPYLETVFSDLDTVIEAGIFIPNPSPDNCRPCSVQRFCYAGGGTDSTYFRDELKVLTLART